MHIPLYKQKHLDTYFCENMNYSDTCLYTQNAQGKDSQFGMAWDDRGCAPQPRQPQLELPNQSWIPRAKQSWLRRNGRQWWICVSWRSMAGSFASMEWSDYLEVLDYLRRVYAGTWESFDTCTTCNCVLTMLWLRFKLVTSSLVDIICVTF